MAAYQSKIKVLRNIFIFPKRWRELCLTPAWGMLRSRLSFLSEPNTNTWPDAQMHKMQSCHDAFTSVCCTKIRTTYAYEYAYFTTQCTTLELIVGIGCVFVHITEAWLQILIVVLWSLCDVWDAKKKCTHSCSLHANFFLTKLSIVQLLLKPCPGDYKQCTQSWLPNIHACACEAVVGLVSL